MKIKIFLVGLCLLVNCSVFGYEINGNTVTQTSSGGTRIELANPMRIESVGVNHYAGADSTLQRKNAPIGWKIISNPNDINLSLYLSDLVLGISDKLPENVNEQSGKLDIKVKILKDGSLTDFDIVENTLSKDYSDKILNVIKNSKGKSFSDIGGFKPIEISLNFVVFKRYIKEKSSIKPDFGPYMRELQRRIKANWNPPIDYRTKRVSVLMKIMNNGKLESCNVFQSSGNPKADKEAVDAVYKSSPFKPLPPEYKGEAVEIQFTFDYNVFSPFK